MHLYTHPDCEKHELFKHPERPDRLSAVIERLNASGLSKDMQTHLAKEISDNHLKMFGG